MPLRVFLALGLLLAGTMAASAAPAVNNVSLRGLQAGGTTTLTFAGSDLAASPKLIAPFAIASQEVVGMPRGNQVQLKVTLADSVAPGIYSVRLATESGISAPIMLGVDRLAQLPFGETIESLPAALSGALGGGQIMKTSFAGKKDQPLVVDVEVQRLGAGFRPVVRLYDSRGRQLAYSPPQPSLGGDARLAMQLPADDTYTIELHDMLYRAQGPGYFRLKVGELAYADFALPLAATRGAEAKVALVSTNLADGTTANVDFRQQQIPGEEPLALSIPNFTGAAPSVLVSEYAEAVEAPPGDEKQTLSAPPCAVSGRIAKRGEEDQYVVPVSAGQRLRVEVVARRIGSLLDGVLVVRAPQGNELARSDDQPGTPDPAVEVTVPEGADKIIVSVSDMQQRFCEQHVYRVIVRDAGLPDFAATIDVDTIHVPAGGTAVVPVQVTRSNYGGPIRLRAEGLVGDVSLAGEEIPAGGGMALLTLSATSGNLAQGVIRLIAEANEGGVQRMRYVAGPDSSGATRHQPHLRRSIGLAVTPPAPIAVAWSAAESEKPFLGGKLPLQVKLSRQEGVTGDVRLRLLTTQPMPKKKVKENNQEKEVDDVERALRLAEGMPVLKPEQPEATVHLAIPGDLPQQPWGVVLVAELLGADGKTVVATNATSAQMVTPEVPFSLELTSAPQAEGRAGLGEAGNFTGVVRRAPGFAQPVTVTLAGLPKEITPPLVTIPADKSEFVLPLSFTYGTKAGEQKGARLVATFASSGAAVQSNEIAVAVNIVPGEKPPAEQPLEVFEDDENFVTQLTSGSGTASVDGGEKHSGDKALKVTPDQKFNEKLPNLNVKIRENPGPGEYRYLTFAWKKRGGQSICLQLNHDGVWGPVEGSSGRPGAKFRYHAGPGGECFGASVVIDDKLPTREYVVVTRDLFADFGEFTLTGMAFSPVDGQYGLFDRIYLGKTPADFELIGK